MCGRRPSVANRCEDPVVECSAVCSRYELDDYYFLVDPRQLIYTHYPEDKRWQLLEQPYTLSEFEDLPPVKSLFFRYGLKLETHTNAVIRTNDSFSLSVSRPRRATLFVTSVVACSSSCHS